MTTRDVMFMENNFYVLCLVILVFRASCAYNSLIPIPKGQIASPPARDIVNVNGQWSHDVRQRTDIIKSNKQILYSTPRFYAVPPRPN